MPRFPPCFRYFAPSWIRRSLYEEDYFAWLQQQAAALRWLAQSRRDLPNDLDIEQIAEEIEDVGKSELLRVESFIRLILPHLIKKASLPAEWPLRHWKREIAVFRIDLVRRLTPSMRQKIDLNELWRIAGIKADADLAREGEEIAPGLPGRCPFSLDDLTDKGFDFEAAVARIRPTAAGLA